MFEGAASNCISTANQEDVTSTLQLLNTYFNFASDSSTQHLILKDKETIGCLAYWLDCGVVAVVESSLQILFLLSHKTENAKRLREVFGVKEALNKLTLKKQELPDRMCDMLQIILQRLDRAKAEMCSPKTEKSPQSATDTKRFLITNNIKTKCLNFVLCGPFTEGNRREVESLLLQQRGVVSIYFDGIQQRCILRTKPEVSAEKMAGVIASTGAFQVKQAVKDVDGRETLLDYSAKDSNEDCASGELPDYLPEDFGLNPSPERDTGKTLVRLGDKFCKDGKGGWLGGIAKFVSDSFYW